MTDQLQRLHDEMAASLEKDEQEIHRLNDRCGVYRHVLARLNDAIRDSAMGAPETADETERRREKRDIRGAIVGILQGGSALPARIIQDRARANIGDITDSALARSLSSLVGDGSIIERDGVFSLPRPAPAGYNEAQAAK